VKKGFIFRIGSTETLLYRLVLSHNQHSTLIFRTLTLFSCWFL